MGLTTILDTLKRGSRRINESRLPGQTRIRGEVAVEEVRRLRKANQLRERKRESRRVLVSSRKQGNLSAYSKKKRRKMNNENNIHIFLKLK